MENFGKFAVCGADGKEVIISKYNCMCPCLNCVGCNKQMQCQWKYVLENNPCTYDDMRRNVCQNCIKITNMNQR